MGTNKDTGPGVRVMLQCSNKPYIINMLRIVDS